MREPKELADSDQTPWKTESAVWSYIRGGIRRGIWNKHPLKLDKLKSERFKAPIGKITKRNPEGLVWACKCALCGETFREAVCEVDHVEMASQERMQDNLEGFIRHLAFVLLEDLQVVCKPCHKIKSHAERYGMSFEEAKIEKKVIEFKKLKAHEQAATLSVKELPKGSNANERVEIWRGYLYERQSSNGVQGV